MTVTKRTLRHKFVCDWCGESKIITDLELRSFRFAGMPECCHGRAMRRVVA